MPLLTRWFVRLALVYLALAMVLAVLSALQPWWPAAAVLGNLRPVYLHLLMVGWATQLIFGVAYWMLPKESTARPRGNERLGWATLGLLNAGLILRALGEPLVAAGAEALGPALAASALLQWLAGLAFVANTWRRVK